MYQAGIWGSKKYKVLLLSPQKVHFFGKSIKRQSAKDLNKTFFSESICLKQAPHHQSLEESK